MPVVFHDAMGTYKIKQLLPQCVGLFFFVNTQVDENVAIYTSNLLLLLFSYFTLYEFKKINNFIAEESMK